MEDIRKRVVSVSLESIINTCNACLSELKNNSLERNKLPDIALKHLKIMNEIILCHQLICIDETICGLKCLVDNFIKDVQNMNTIVNDEHFNDYVYYKDNLFTIRLTATNIKTSRYN